ncbi:MAG: hypothetical protein ABSD78_03365 [Acidimicrobiales bacterium]|jgi:hypothetical protein
MSLRASLVLRASALFAVWIWVVLIRNMVIAAHDSWSFRLIHIGLGVASIAFAVATWVITNNSRRFTKSVGRAGRPPSSGLTSVSAAGAAGAIGRGIGGRRRSARDAGSELPVAGPPGVAAGGPAGIPGMSPGGGAPGLPFDSPATAGSPLPVDRRD